MSLTNVSSDVESEEAEVKEVGRKKYFFQKDGKGQGSRTLSFNKAELALFNAGKTKEAVEAFLVRKPNWIIEGDVILVGEGPGFELA
jgi:hypothetical protein